MSESFFEGQKRLDSVTNRLRRSEFSSAGEKEKLIAEYQDLIYRKHLWSWEKESGVLWLLREYLEQNFPDFHYLRGGMRGALRVWKKTFWPLLLRSHGDTIKIYMDGEIEVLDDKYVWFVDIIQERMTKIVTEKHDRITKIITETYDKNIHSLNKNTEN